MSGILLAAPVLKRPITLGGGSGGTVQALDGAGPYDSTVAIRFNTDGTVETAFAINGGALVFTGAGFWITNGVPDGSYDVRFTNLVQNLGAIDWTTEAAADDVFIDLSAQRVWSSNRTGVGERDFDVDFEVRKNAGPPPPTGSSSWTFNIDNVI